MADRIGTRDMIIFSSHSRAVEQWPMSPDDEFALAVLADMGFLGRMPDERSWTWTGPDPDADRRLLALLSRFDLQVEVLQTEDGAAWLALLVWEPNSAPGSTRVGAAFTGT